MSSMHFNPKGYLEYLLIIYIAVKPCMLYFELLFCSRPRALAARVYYVKLLPTWNKDYLSIYIYNNNNTRLQLGDYKITYNL